MTTVINPGGSPVVIFSKDGTAVLDMAFNVGPSEPIIPIPYFAQRTLVRADVTLTGSPADGGIELPTSAEIGDVVEICTVGTLQNVPVWCASGEDIDERTFPGQCPILAGTLKRFVKIAATKWRIG